MNIVNYFNVFGSEYQKACTGFSQISLPKKIAISILTAVSGIFTVGVAALPVFRLLTETWKPKSTAAVQTVGQAFFSCTPLGPNEATVDEAGKLISHGPLNEVEKIIIRDLTNLEKVPESVFQCTNAKVFNGSNCGLKELPANIGELSHLETLDLRDNQLSHIPDMGKLTELKTLLLCNNRLKTPPDISQLRELTELHLEGNPDLTDLPDLTNCKKLERITIDRTLFDKVKDKLVPPSDTKPLEVVISLPGGTAKLTVYHR